MNCVMLLCQGFTRCKSSEFFPECTIELYEMEVLNNWKFFEKNMGKKVKKIIPEVADDHHGGPGRVHEGENGLADGESFWNFDLCW